MCLIGVAAVTRQLDMALAMFIQFTAYLRPGELIALTGDRLISPHAQGVTPFWALLLSPQEEMVAGKTGEFDESVLLDAPVLISLHSQLQTLKARAKFGHLWSFSYADYLRTFHNLVELSNLEVLAPYPYSLRHGGASHDSLTKRLTFSQIK